MKRVLFVISTLALAAPVALGSNLRVGESESGIIRNLMATPSPTPRGTTGMATPSPSPREITGDDGGNSTDWDDKVEQLDLLKLAMEIVDASGGSVTLEQIDAFAQKELIGKGHSLEALQKVGLALKGKVTKGMTIEDIARLIDDALADDGTPPPTSDPWDGFTVPDSVTNAMGLKYLKENIDVLSGGSLTKRDVMILAHHMSNSRGTDVAKGYSEEQLRKAGESLSYKVKKGMKYEDLNQLLADALRDEPREDNGDKPATGNGNGTGIPDTPDPRVPKINIPEITGTKPEEALVNALQKMIPMTPDQMSKLNQAFISGKFTSKQLSHISSELVANAKSGDYENFEELLESVESEVQFWREQPDNSFTALNGVFMSTGAIAGAMSGAAAAVIAALFVGFKFGKGRSSNSHSPEEFSCEMQVRGENPMRIASPPQHSDNV